MKRYLNKYAIRTALFEGLPESNLGISIVIPTRNEQTLHQLISSLSICEKPGCSVEIVVVIYSWEADKPEVTETNKRTLAFCQAWQRISDRALQVHVYHCDRLPNKFSGRSLALKIGMDEALRRFDLVNNPRGLIVPMNADSTVSLNFLVGLAAHFKSNADSDGCSIRYQYPSFGTECPAEVYQDALYRELHLRYCNQALRYTGFPFAFHICDSAWAVAAEAYAKQGGIDKHHADASLRFLNKIMLLENFTELNDVLIFLSPKRLSDPAGSMVRTERRFRGDTAHSHFTYDIRSFIELRNFFKNIPELYFSGAPLHTLGDTTSYTVMEFLSAYFFDERISEIRRNSGSITSFERRFFRWFNTLMVFKYLDFVRDNAIAATRTDRSALEFLRVVEYGSPAQINSLSDLLEAFRKLDAQSHRAGWLVLSDSDRS